MSIVAPPPRPPPPPPSLDLSNITNLNPNPNPNHKPSHQTTGFPFSEPPHTPFTPNITTTLPLKSPKRKQFFPLTTTSSTSSSPSADEQKKYAAKPLPGTPARKEKRIHHVKTSDESVSWSTPVIVRSNPRFSNVSTAVGSLSPSPSPSLSLGLDLVGGVRDASASGLGSGSGVLSLSSTSPLRKVPTSNTTNLEPRGRTRSKSEIKYQSQSTTSLTKSQSQPRRPQTAVLASTNPSEVRLAKSTTSNSNTTTPSPRQTLFPSSTPSITPSLNINNINNINNSANPPPQTTTERIREGAFFAFVLLPLSCWYTRGGKRLKEIDMREIDKDHGVRERSHSRSQSYSQAWSQSQFQDQGQAHGKEKQSYTLNLGHGGNTDAESVRMPPRATSGSLNEPRNTVHTRAGARVRWGSFNGHSDGYGRTTPPNSRRQQGQGQQQQQQQQMRERRSLDDTIIRRLRVGSDGADLGFDCERVFGPSRTRSLRQHPDFDFEIAPVPLVRSTTTRSGIFEELMPGRAI